MERAPPDLELIQHRDVSGDRLVLGTLQQIPLEGSVRVPLASLTELGPHEQQELPGVECLEPQ